MKYGVKYVARGNSVTPMFGGNAPERAIIIEFPSKKGVEKCFGSADYAAIARLRERSTESRAIVLDSHTHDGATKGGRRE